MKKGKIIVIIAILMSSVTLVWGLFKRLPVDERFLNEIPVQPAKSTSNSAFYPVESLVFTNINAPVDVVLDPSFSGLKLKGDSTLFQHFYIETDQSANQRQGIVVRADTGSKGGVRDSLVIAKLQNSDLAVYIGTQGNKNHPYVEYQFTECKSVHTLSTLNLENVRLDFDFVGSCDLSINSTQMAIWAHGKQLSTQSDISIDGSCGRLFINDCSNMNMDLKSVNTKELYAFDMRDSKVQMHASNIANIMRVCNTEFEVIGNPKHYKESKIGEPYCKN